MPRTRNRFLRRAIIGVVASTMMLAGCAGGGSGSSGEPEGAADPNATLRFGYGTDGGKNYDPVTAANQFVPGFLLPVYDRLFDLDEDGKVIPMLAESSEYSADGLSLTLKLRKGVKFHDGTAFDASAVKANIERGKTNAKSTIKPDLATVETVDVIDPQTVKLNLNAPNGALTAILADRAGMMVSPTAMDNPDLDLMPVGAGPYKVTADDPGVKVTYERFDDYYNLNKNAVKTIEMMIQLDPETRLRSITTNELDATGINMNQLDSAKKQGIRLAEPAKVSTATYLVYLNMARNPALANPKVREALALAIDRDGINKGLLGGSCDPTAQMFPKGYWAAATDIPKSAIVQDTKKAKELLTEAGYPDGFEMSLAAINVQQYSNVAEALAEQFEKIGIKVDLQITEPVQLLGNFNAQKVTDAYTSIWPGAGDPSRTVSSLYLPTGLFNPGALDIPEVTKLAAEGLAGKDQAARAASYQALSKVTVEQRMHLPICSASLPTAMTSKVRGIPSTVASVVDLRNVEITK